MRSRWRGWRCRSRRGWTGSPELGIFQAAVVALVVPAGGAREAHQSHRMRAGEPERADVAREDRGAQLGRERRRGDLGVRIRREGFPAPAARHVDEELGQRDIAHGASQKS